MKQKIISWLKARLSTSGCDVGVYGVMNSVVLDNHPNRRGVVLKAHCTTQSTLSLETDIVQDEASKSFKRYVELQRWFERQDAEVLFRAEHAVESSDAMRQYDELLKSLKKLNEARPPVASVFSLGGACIIALAFVFVSAMLIGQMSARQDSGVTTSSAQAMPMAGTGVSPQGVANALMSPEGAPPSDPNSMVVAEMQRRLSMDPNAIAPPSEADLSGKPRLTEDQYKKLSKASAFFVSGDGKDKQKVFYAMSDPLCPACRKMEDNLKGGVQGFSQVIVPVAFKPGAMEVAASVLCLPKQQQAKAWREAVAGGMAQGKPCEAGIKQVESNNALFQEFGFDGTPTLVSTRRLFLAGSGTKDQVAFWLARF